MKANELRHRVTLQSQVATQDDLGQPSTSWLDTATVWADVRHLNGLDTIKSGADTSVSKVSIRLRYRPASPAMRVLHGTAVYQVQAVLPDARKAFVDLACEAVNVVT